MVSAAGEREAEPDSRESAAEPDAASHDVHFDPPAMRAGVDGASSGTDSPAVAAQPSSALTGSNQRGSLDAAQPPQSQGDASDKPHGPAPDDASGAATPPTDGEQPQRSGSMGASGGLATAAAADDDGALEEEPRLKYQRLGCDLTMLLATAAATCLAISDKVHSIVLVVSRHMTHTCSCNNDEIWTAVNRVTMAQRLPAHQQCFLDVVRCSRSAPPQGQCTYWITRAIR